MEMTEESVILRPYNQTTDAGFVFSVWRRAVWHDANTGDIDAEFYHKKTKEIKDLLANNKTDVKVACLKSSPDFLVGYSVINESVIEFVYVKLDYRKQGIASILCKGAKAVVKPTTKIGAAIVRRLNLEVKENNGSTT